MFALHAYNETNLLHGNFSHPAHFAIIASVLFVFAISPVIICGNTLVLAAMYRFKRLRTPSNYLLASLATSDLGVGLFLPFAMYAELTQSVSCLLVYCVAITLCGASVIVMAAIAVDRFTSLSQPLRYNDLVTHTSMLKYLAASWIYSLIVGFSPAMHEGSFRTASVQECTFSNSVDKTMQLFLFCTIYGPCCTVLVLCYTYIYILARYHARAIHIVEVSVRRDSDAVCVSRYGQTLAITVGCFVCLWTPFQVCMLWDIFHETSFLESWMPIYLSLPIFTGCAVNPWIYGYRNSEIRTSIQRVIEEILGEIGISSHQEWYASPPVLGCQGQSRQHGEQAELNSYGSNLRLCASSPNRTAALLLPPQTKENNEMKTSLLTVPGTIDCNGNDQQ